MYNPNSGYNPSYGQQQQQYNRYPTPQSNYNPTTNPYSSINYNNYATSSPQVPSMNNTTNNTMTTAQYSQQQQYPQPYNITNQYAQPQQQQQQQYLQQQYSQTQTQYSQPQSQYPQQQVPLNSVYGTPANNFNWYNTYYNQNTPQQLTELQAWFNSVDRDRSGFISAVELANQVFAGQPLGYHIAVKLIKIFDKDYSGQLDFQEYASLHQFLLKLQNAFYTADVDRSGFLDDREIWGAIQSTGFQISYPTVKEVCGRFDYIQGKGLSILSYLQVCIHLARLRSIFEWNDIQRRGQITLTYDQLAHITTHLLDK